MLQGDAYPLRFTLKDNDGTTITDEMVSDVEIVVGNLKKTYAKSEITYEQEKWVFPLSQTETLAINSDLFVQVRVKFINGGNVVGKVLSPISIDYSRSKEVL